MQPNSIHSNNDRSVPAPAGSPTSMSRRFGIGFAALLVLVVIFGGMFALGLSPRDQSGGAIADVARDARPTVIVVAAQRANANMELVLPGTLLPIQETPIYARTSGYVKRWSVDIGTKVNAGQLLAEIDTPELDRELKQAMANVQQVKANLALSKSTAERWQSLLKDNAVSRQEVDEKVSAYDVRKADLAAIQANVQRLQELKSFQRVVAPFAGTITARQVELGQLIGAGSIDSNRWLYKLAKTDVLRVYVNVPQSHMRSIQPETSVAVVMREFQGKPFAGRVMRTAGALDPQSKTLLTEVQIPNANSELMAGMYGQVKFTLTQSQPSILIPSNTLIIRADGPQVAAVENNTVRMRKVTLGRDLGTQIEILAGLNEQELIVTNPTDSMREGVSVKTALAPTEKPAEKPTAKPPDKPMEKQTEKHTGKVAEKQVGKK